MPITTLRLERAERHIRNIIILLIITMTFTLVFFVYSVIQRSHILAEVMANRETFKALCHCKDDE